MGVSKGCTPKSPATSYSGQINSAGGFKGLYAQVACDAGQTRMGARVCVSKGCTPKSPATPQGRVRAGDLKCFKGLYAQVACDIQMIVTKKGIYFFQRAVRPSRLRPSRPLFRRGGNSVSKGCTPKSPATQVIVLPSAAGGSFKGLYAQVACDSVAAMGVGGRRGFQRAVRPSRLRPGPNALKFGVSSFQRAVRPSRLRLLASCQVILPSHLFQRAVRPSRLRRLLERERKNLLVSFKGLYAQVACDSVAAMGVGGRRGFQRAVRPSRLRRSAARASFWRSCFKGLYAQVACDFSAGCSTFGSPVSKGCTPKSPATVG